MSASEKPPEANAKQARHPDGTITHFRPLESTAGEDFAVACERAILEGVPFPKWSKAVRRAINNDYRLDWLVFEVPG